MILKSIPSFRSKLQVLSNPVPQVLILYYHRVLPEIKWGDPFSLQVTVDNFAHHIEQLSRNYRLISLQEFVRQYETGAFLKRRQVVITFDDGYRDNYLYAYPVLERWHVPAIIFLTADAINTHTLFFWEQLHYNILHTCQDSFTLVFPEERHFALKTERERKAAFWALHKMLRNLAPSTIAKITAQFPKSIYPVDECDLPLTWEQIRTMDQGGIYFGAHTCSHPVLARLSPSEAEEEIVRSKQILEEHLQQEIDLFAYPYGEADDFTEETKGILKKHHFRCACSTSFGTNTIPGDLLHLKRVVVRNWDVATLAHKIAHVFKHQEWIL